VSLYESEMEARVDELEAECDALNAEVEALRADAERWRTVRGWFRVSSLHINNNHGWYPSGEWGRITGPTIDSAVDRHRAALAKEQP
jgi:hypothetical protein